MWLKAQNEMAGLWPHAAMGPVERVVRRLCEHHSLVALTSQAIQARIRNTSAV